MTAAFPFPQVWDASMLNAFRSCPHKWMREYGEHWKPKSSNVHLQAGAAFAKGLEDAREAFYVSNLSAEESIQKGLKSLMASYGDFIPPEGSAKSLDRMLGALEFYFDRYPLGSDPAVPSIIGGKRGIEFSFAEPLPLTHPISREPLIWCGRADQIVDYAGGVFISDDKTTSQLGSSWARQWDLRSQFSGYCWAAKQSGIKVQGVLVRGISILKTKYDTAEAITYRPEWFLERWLLQTTRDISRAMEMWLHGNGYFDYSLDEACTAYGGCMFRQVCLSQDPQPFLDVGFERRYWNPLTRIETPL